MNLIVVNEYIKVEANKWSKKFNKVQKDLDIQINKIQSLEGDLCFDFAQYHNDITLKSIPLDSEEEFVKYLELSLVICENYAKSLCLKTDVYPKFERSVKDIIKSFLQGSVEKFSDKEHIILKEMGYKRFLRIQEHIHKVADKEDKQNLAIIFGKLDFPDLD